MKKWICSLLLLLFAGCASRVSGIGDSDIGEIHENDLALIEALHTRDTEASRNWDVEALLALADENIVILSPGERPVVGKDEMRAYLVRNEAASAGLTITGYSHDFREVKVIGEWAFEWGVAAGSAERTSGGESLKWRYHLFRVLRKQPDGSWKVARAVWNEAPL